VAFPPFEYPDTYISSARQACWAENAGIVASWILS
jgi:hypothetical protein